MSAEKPWNVFIVSPKFFPETAGYAHAITGLVRTVVERNAKIKLSVLTMSRDQRAEKTMPDYLKNIEITRGRQDGIHRYLFELLHIPYALRRFKDCDVVFFETADLFILGWVASLVCPEKVVIREQGCWSSEIIRFKDTLVFRLCRLLVRRHYRRAKVLAPTTPYYNHFVFKHYFNENEYVAATKKYTYIPNTSYLKPGNQEASRQELASRFPLRQDARWMLTLGRQDLDGLLQKGFEDVLYGLERLHRRGESLPDYQLIIIGDGSEHDHLVSLTHKLNLDEHVVFIQALPHEDVVALTKACDAVVLCSRFEGMSMFATETLALGNAVIYTRAGGLNGMVEEGLNGYAPKAGDIDSIERALHQLLQQDMETLKKMGRESRALFERKFSPDRVYQQFIDALSLTQ